MTTYRAVSDTEVAVDAPLTQQLMQSLKDNQLAIGEGASGAPRQSHLAIGNVEAGEKPIIFWARNTGQNGSTSATSSDYYSKTWAVAKCGTYRFKVMAQGQDINGRVETQLYKIAAGDDGAGSVVLTTTGGAVSDEVYNQADIVFATGDKFYIRNKFTSGQSSCRRFSRLIVSVLQPLTNFCETFEIGNQGSISANNAYDSRRAVNGDGQNGSSIPKFEDLEDYGLTTTDAQFNALDLTNTER
tara:strand:+ start:12229 stop:12957 length:729 start_codon:yes stop_codon:yes gene_type:complete